MDEPTKGVDVALRVDLYNTMNGMVNKGASIILIAMSDRILVLAGGRITAEIPQGESEQGTHTRIRHRRELNVGLAQALE